MKGEERPGKERKGEERREKEEGKEPRHNSRQTKMNGFWGGQKKSPGGMTTKGGGSTGREWKLTIGIEKITLLYHSVIITVLTVLFL